MCVFCVSGCVKNTLKLETYAKSALCFWTLVPPLSLIFKCAEPMALKPHLQSQPAPIVAALRSGLVLFGFSWQFNGWGPCSYFSFAQVISQSRDDGQSRQLRQGAQQQPQRLTSFLPFLTVLLDYFVSFRRAPVVEDSTELNHPTTTRKKKNNELKRICFSRRT